jgi:hypothetical protein
MGNASEEIFRSVQPNENAMANPNGKRIEWTGAGGDYFLGVAVSEHDEILAECWGTEGEVLAWIEKQGLPAKYVPMALSSPRRRNYRKKRGGGVWAAGESRTLR